MRCATTFEPFRREGYLFARFGKDQLPPTVELQGRQMRNVIVSQLAFASLQEVSKVLLSAV